jgi:spore coat polysaccharide biosynthesis predicted glycosyltransferase SpsG
MSDDIEEVKKEFAAYKDAYFSNQNVINDFQLLQHANAAIISPSSYAWWACWLNKVPNAKIIVPKYFLGFKVNKEFPVNMIPKHFVQSEVYQG